MDNNTAVSKIIQIVFGLTIQVNLNNGKGDIISSFNSVIRKIE